MMLQKYALNIATVCATLLCFHIGCYRAELSPKNDTKPSPVEEPKKNMKKDIFANHKEIQLTSQTKWHSIESLHWSLGDETEPVLFDVSASEQLNKSGHVNLSTDSPNEVTVRLGGTPNKPRILSEGDIIIEAYNIVLHDIVFIGKNMRVMSRDMT